MDESQKVMEVIELGKKCAVDITGDPDDAAEVQDFETAMLAIKAALTYGKEANHELNKLRLKV